VAEGCGAPTTPVPGQSKGYSPFVGPICSPDGKAAIVTAYLKGDGEADSLLDPIQEWRETGLGPRRRPPGEAHRRRRLRRGCDRGVHLHQRHPAVCCPHPCDRAAGGDLPFADLPVHSAGGCHVRGDPVAVGRLRRVRAGGHDQRPVQLDHVHPRAGGGHRLRPADRRALPRGAAQDRRSPCGGTGPGGPTPSFALGRPASSNSRWAELPVVSSRTHRTGASSRRAARSSAPSTRGRTRNAGERSQKPGPRPTSSSESAQRSRPRSPRARTRRTRASAPR